MGQWTPRRPPYRHRRSNRPSHLLINGGLLVALVGLAAWNSGGGGRTVGAPGAYYPNCDAARAAGAAPIYAGEPGYRPPLDADDDGIACEPYR